MLVQAKLKISMSYSSSINAWKPIRRMRLGLILMMRDIHRYTSVPTWTHSQNLVAAIEGPSLEMCSHGTSLKWSMVGTKIIINCVMKMWIHFEFEEKSMETETTTWSISRRRETTVEQILGLEVGKKSKRVGQCLSQSEIRVGMLTIWVRLCEKL